MSPRTGIGFDLFNTLVRIPGKHKAYHRLITHFESQGITRQQVVHALLTHNQESVAFLFEHFSITPYQELILNTDEAVRAEVESTILYPETLIVLEKLSKKHSLCLISNLSAPYTTVVSRLGLEPFFDLLLFSCVEGCTKPEEVIFEMAKKFMVNEGAALYWMIGDSKKDDIEGAKAAGIKGILVERNQKPTHKDRIQDLREFELLLNDYEGRIFE